MVTVITRSSAATVTPDQGSPFFSARRKEVCCGRQTQTSSPPGPPRWGAQLLELSGSSLFIEGAGGHARSIPCSLWAATKKVAQSYWLGHTAPGTAWSLQVSPAHTEPSPEVASTANWQRTKCIKGLNREPTTPCVGGEMGDLAIWTYAELLHSFTTSDGIPKNKWTVNYLSSPLCAFFRSFESFAIQNNAKTIRVRCFTALRCAYVINSCTQAGGVKDYADLSF